MTTKQNKASALTTPTDRLVILIVDDKDENRETLSRQVETLGAGQFEARAVKDADAARRVVSDIPFQLAVLAVDLALSGSTDAASATELIREFHAQYPGIPIVAYTFLLLGDIEERVRQAGASDYVQTSDVGAVITRIFLERELAELRRKSPLVEHVLNSMNVGISVLDANMRLLWANGETRNRTGVTLDQKGTLCWECFHGFRHRGRSCVNCAASQVLEETRACLREGRQADIRGSSTHTCLLPVLDEISPIEVTAAPVLTPDRKQLLAVIETSKPVHEAWENTPEDKQFHEVLSVAHAMTRQSESAEACRYVAVYYQRMDEDDLHLFDSSTTEGRASPPNLLRWQDLGERQRRLLSGEDERLQVRQPLQSDQRRLFQWATRVRSGIANRILVEAAYTQTKPQGLFTEDLRPYWLHLSKGFDAAHQARDAEMTTRTHVGMREFLADVAQLRKATEDRERKIIDRAVRCVRSMLSAFSVHVRTLDRKTNQLQKVAGYGPHFDLTPDRRPLVEGDTGSTRAVSRREDVWVFNANVAEIKKSLGRELSPEESHSLDPISSYVTLPLLFTGRALGTLSIQFDDDSLSYEANKDFVKLLGQALSSEIGALAVEEERDSVTREARSLDENTFNVPEDANELDRNQQALVRQAARLIFELSYAETVAYYRLHPATEVLELDTLSVNGAPPGGMALPKSVPLGMGVLGMAAAAQKPKFMQTPEDESYRKTRYALRACLTIPEEVNLFKKIRSEIAVPVLVENEVQGVFVAVSVIKEWLTDSDFEIAKELALKTGRCIQVWCVALRLSDELTMMRALHEIRTEIGKMEDLHVVYRLFLLALTTGHCLGFTRAALFMRESSRQGEVFALSWAVGSTKKEAAEGTWTRMAAEKATLHEQIEACKKAFEDPQPTDLFAALRDTLIDLANERKLAEGFAQRQYVFKRPGQPHVIEHAGVECLFGIPDENHASYAVLPFQLLSSLQGFVIVDRAFLRDGQIGEGRLELAMIVADQIPLWARAILDRRAAEELALGVTYSLRTRAAELESRIWRLKRKLGATEVEEVEGLERAVEFFHHAGTIAGRMAKPLEFGKSEPVQVNDVIQRVSDFVSDARIELHLEPGLPKAEIAPDRPEESIMEILANARHFARNRIEVRTSLENRMVRIDIQDDGEGIHPDLRPRLFGRFQCYPVNRMGLGLAYVKTVVEGYGGSICEISTYDEGAHFIVSFPTEKE